MFIFFIFGSLYFAMIFSDDVSTLSEMWPPNNSTSGVEHGAFEVPVKCILRFACHPKKLIDLYPVIIAENGPSNQ